MNKTSILLIISILLSGISTIQAQTEKESPNEIHISPVGFNQDDSLLYDGHFGKLKPANFSSDCKITVKYSFGTVEGTKYVTKVYDICGEIDTGMSTKKSEIKTGDKLKYGEEITTGDDAGVDIELWDGSEVKLGPNSSVVIEDYMCEGSVLVQLKNGSMWSKVKHLLGGAKYEVKCITMGGVRGTEFTVEFKNNVEIIKVYEGTFEVYAPKNQNNDNKNRAKEMEQLTKDFQAGKITKEEFNRKLTELMQNANQKIDEMTNKMCTAGNMVKVTNVISDIMPFDTGADRWFDDANFKK